jgi:lipocalin
MLLRLISTDLEPLSATAFKLDRYIEKSWYIQKQQVNPYQAENQLYCVVATYNKRDDGFIQVNNYGNQDVVNGTNTIDGSCFAQDLCARQLDGGSLQVAPCLFGFTFGLVAGPYWIVAVADDYSWSIVSGGKPNEVLEEVDGRTFCTTKEGCSFLDINGSGLWLFTRDKVANATTIATMEAKLNELGIFAGNLKTVAQEGCTYEGAVLK